MLVEIERHYDEASGFYAVYYRPTNWGAIGGIVIDDVFYALGEGDEPIANLFAVGEMSITSSSAASIWAVTHWL